MAASNNSKSTNVQQSLAIKLEYPVTSISISPSGNDVVLAAKRGLYILNLERPYEQPRFLQHLTKWDVADVQWNPHNSRSNWIATTSNQKTLIWNIARGAPTAGSTQSVAPSQNNVELIINKHTRAVSDIHWSPFHPESIATCSYDAYIHLWDLRQSTVKPSMSFSSWTVGATQVKYNRINEWIIASSHDTDVRIWDARKGSSPLTLITAHMTKIYGIDWSRNNENELITCSQDKLVKFWNTSQPRMCQSTIVTTAPIWRARYTPFGNAVITMPQRKNNDLYLWSCQNRTSPLYTFSGDNDVPAEFVWRCIDGHYQLITWSKDQIMRLWPISADVVKGAEICSDRDLSLETIGDRADMTPSFSNQSNYSSQPENLTLIAQHTSNQFPNRPRDLDMMPFEEDDDFSDGGLEFRSDSLRAPLSSFADLSLKDRKRSNAWLKRSSNGLNDSNQKETDRIASSTPSKTTIKAAADHSVPVTLEEEIHQVERHFSDVHIDKTNIAQRSCSLSIESASDHLWSSTVASSGKLFVFLRIDAHFPFDYPHVPAHFEIQKTGMTSMANRTFLTVKLGQIATAFATKSLPCLEACVRYLLGDPNATAPIPSVKVYGDSFHPSSLSGTSAGFSVDSHHDPIDRERDHEHTLNRDIRGLGRSPNDYSISETSSSDAEGSVPLMGKRVKPIGDRRLMRETTTGKDKGNVPFPVLCAASFSMCGKLVYFKSPLPHPSTTKFTTYTLSSRNQQPVLQSQHFQTQPKTYPLYESYRAFVLSRFPKITVAAAGSNVSTAGDILANELVSNEMTTMDTPPRTKSKMDFWLDDDPAGEEETAPSLFWRKKPASSFQPTVFTSPDFLVQLQRFSSPAPTSGSGASGKKKHSLVSATNLFGSGNLQGLPNTQAEPSIQSRLRDDVDHSSPNNIFDAMERTEKEVPSKQVAKNHRRRSSTISTSSNTSDASFDDMLAKGFTIPFMIPNRKSLISNMNENVTRSSTAILTLSPSGAKSCMNIDTPMLQASVTPSFALKHTSPETLSVSSKNVDTSYLSSDSPPVKALHRPVSDAYKTPFNAEDDFNLPRRRHRSISDTSDRIKRHLKSDMDVFENESVSDISDIEFRFASRYQGESYGRTHAPIPSTPAKSGLQNNFGSNHTPFIGVHMPAGIEYQNGYGTIVHTWDVSSFLPMRRDLAEKYTLCGSDCGKICRNNRNVALGMGLVDLAKIWNIAELVVNQNAIVRRTLEDDDNVHFQRMHWQNHPFGRRMVHSLFNQLERMGDLQTLAMLVCVFAEKSNDVTPEIHQIQVEESVPAYQLNRLEAPIFFHRRSDPVIALSLNNPINQYGISRNSYSGSDLPFLVAPNTTSASISIDKNMSKANNIYHQTSPVQSIRGNSRAQTLMQSYPHVGMQPISGVSIGSLSSLVYSSTGSLVSTTGMSYVSDVASRSALIGTTASKSMGIPSRHRESGGRLVRTLSTGGAGSAAVTGKLLIGSPLSNSHIVGMLPQTSLASLPTAMSSIDRVNTNLVMRPIVHSLSPPSLQQSSTSPFVAANMLVASPIDLPTMSTLAISTLGSMAVKTSPSLSKTGQNINLVITEMHLDGDYQDEFKPNMILAPSEATPNLSLDQSMPNRVLSSAEHHDIYQMGLLDPHLCDTYNGYVWRYAELLYSWGLLHQRAELLKFRSFFVSRDHISEHSVGNVIHVCQVCETELRYHKLGQYCLKCHTVVPGFRCSICRLPCKTLAQVCLECNHGGHVGHIQAWFSENTECPTGCGCQCLKLGTDMWSGYNRQ
ncbi:hypothetical protein MT418_005170 [Batrachochytrium dendrobatidis]